MKPIEIKEVNGHYINTNGELYVVNGNEYAVAEQPHLSERSYTKRTVYLIKTNVDSWSTVRKELSLIMEVLYARRIITKDMHDMATNIADALKPYCTFKYIEELDMWEFTYIEPYDD